MSLTADQLAANRQTAIANTRAALGLSNNVTTWTQEQRVTYNAALATVLSASPDQFSDQDLINAEYVKAHPGEPRRKMLVAGSCRA